MKSIISTILVLGVIGLCSFSKDPVHYEQIIFDYFISDILVNDFKDVSSIEFKGKTEETYSTLGSYKLCLRPEEKLQSLITDMTKGLATETKRVKYEQITSITITDFKESAALPKLYMYPAVRVADNFYVFLALSKSNKMVGKYVFELNPEGRILRSCKME